jgi:decaprenylphospho-beta-D-ribofuranose 2-oxidase
MVSDADGYLFRPTSSEDLHQILDFAKSTGRQICLRGAGRTYGDGNIGSECIIVEFSRMNRILEWDPATGLIDCEAGVTIEDLWRHVLEDGYWPPVVSGTMTPQLGGALGMNIHGKNNYCTGTLGEQVTELRVLLTTSELLVLTPEDEHFFDFISSAGLLGIIVGVKMRMKKIDSGDLRVFANAPRNWDEQFRTFERFEHEADYMVSWIDCFGKGPVSGRGQFHAAWYLHDLDLTTLRPDHQDLPDTILGLVPKSVVWRFLKPLNNRFGMRFLNWAKDFAGKTIGNNKTHHQSLVGFSFLLDYVPNWRKAYLPYGFIQYQSFVPKEHAKRVFSRMIELQQADGLESFLAVLKRHRPDRFLFSHAVDGYSLAFDFKVTGRNWKKLQALCHQMNELVLDAGGRFYFAKDSTLRPEDVERWLGPNLDRYRSLKLKFDPAQLLTSNLARRVKLERSVKDA